MRGAGTGWGPASRPGSPARSSPAMASARSPVSAAATSTVPPDLVELGAGGGATWAGATVGRGGGATGAGPTAGRGGDATDAAAAETGAAEAGAATEGGGGVRGAETVRGATAERNSASWGPTNMHATPSGATRQTTAPVATGRRPGGRKQQRNSAPNAGRSLTQT